MSLDKLNKISERFDFLDIGAIELGGFFLALALVQIIPAINQIDWKIYIVLFILLEIRPIIKIFSKENNPELEQ